MELVILGGLSLSALTLSLVMVSFFKTIRDYTLYHKKNQKFSEKVRHESPVSKNQTSNFDFDHKDFSGGWFGI